ncbi:hypothetical protein DRJ22_04090 [Candidatus Woesearchaeota archaeon]|nr:MAG: hypothetical protein DRJ22_04090 [Candidatus Woesearchaeota archaeon]
MTSKTVDFRQISEELKAIKSDLEFIKKHMVDVDSLLTEEDFESLRKYKVEKDKGLLTSHKKLKKELDL